MPVVAGLPEPIMAPRQPVNSKPTVGDHEATGESLWVVDENSEEQQPDMDFSLVPWGKVPCRKGSMNNLRINTYATSDLHDRYMESEEEPSPSPDSETESNDEELNHHKAQAATVSEATESILLDEYEAETATAIPIMAVGRPKLVDITILAPMHKRKRAGSSPSPRFGSKTATNRKPTINGKDHSLHVQKVTKIMDTEDHLPKRTESLSKLAPESWLPEDVTIVEEEEDEHRFPDLELRNPPSYNDYDPYSLQPPRLSPRNSYSSGKKPGSVAHARNTANLPAAANPNGWKGLTRTLSVAKKQTLHRGNQQANKKPKMIARAANERESPLTLPEFPSGERDSN